MTSRKKKHNRSRKSGQNRGNLANPASKSIKMYLFGLNPTICAKFQHLREPSVSIIVVRCATAGPLIKLLRFYWKPASENSDIYCMFNRVLPSRRPFIKEFTSTPLSQRELDADFMTQQSLAGGDRKSLHHRHQVLITLWETPFTCRPPSLPDEVTDQQPPVTEFDGVAATWSSTSLNLRNPSKTLQPPVWHWVPTPPAPKLQH